ncbi:hypothetical protein F0Q45_25315 [Mycobacterium simiae]|uniref:Uncharacterized protein n=2 Tax=Mycobacterium simiae TaxID=1784 RepID=A0A5B1B8A4_MYCSI|nr:hypothetical protein F0Q45_25315 [Mycobacterium simiae]
MAAGRRADSLRRRQRVLKTLNDAHAGQHEITVSAIAQAAGVDRSFLYRHRDLLEQIHAAATEPTNKLAVGGVSTASLQTDLLNAQQRAARLASRVQQLENRLSAALGEQAWRESGIGAPDDVDQLHQQITALEQQIVDLRLQLEERTEELDAARAANRELITRLNTTHGMSGRAQPETAAER